MSAAAAQKPRMALVAAGASIATGIVLLVIKLVAYFQSGADSVLASLIDSACDASVSLMGFIALHMSLKPADTHHRYGHGKAEALAALLQAAFIGGAGVFLILNAVSHLLHPRGADNSPLVLPIMAASTALAILLIGIQRYSLKFAASLAVEADKEHYAADIAVNLGVMAVVWLLGRGAPGWLDPLFALGVGCWLFFITWRVAGKGIDMVLDRELPDETRKAISLRVMACDKVLGIHDLRTFKSGMRIFISFDIEVDPAQSLHDAHEITRDVERGLLEDYPQAEIMIHLDPAGDTADARHHMVGMRR